MISFDEFRPGEGAPIYVQIVRHIKRGIVAGTVTDGDEVPSRRVLSALLGVNPNTIQKAYAILEAEGLMESRTGAKSTMSVNDEKSAAVRDELLRAEAEAAVSALRQMGLCRAEALRLIEKTWGQD